MKAIYNFAKDYLAPVIGKTLGAAFTAFGKIIAGVIDIFAGFVDTLNNIYDRIVSIINAIKSVSKGVTGFFSGSSAPAPTASVAPSPSLGTFMPSSNQTNITVNGAIDPEGTARTIVSVLNNSAARGTLGAAGLVN